MGLSADAYARALRALLPPSKLWRTDADGVVSKLLLAAGDELARVDGRADDLLREADPRTVDEMLPDFEAALAITASGDLAARRAMVLARLLLRQRVRPADYKQVLAPLLGLDPADVVVLERTHAIAAAMGDDREIYRFFIYRDPSLPGTYDVEAAQQVLDLMAQSHTVGHVIESISFLCDDEFSLCDRDLLGA
jgi:hypothetical protein